MYHTKLTAKGMRRELINDVCSKIANRDCGKPCCPIYDICAALGSPNTAEADLIKAMFLIYKHRKGETL